jgi:hypothetical protein
MALLGSAIPAKLTLIRCAIRVLLTVIETDRMLTGVVLGMLSFVRRVDS